MLFRPQARMYLIKLTASQQMSPFSPFYPLLRSRTSLESILVCGANTALQSAARGQTHLWCLWRSKWALPTAAGVGMPCRPLVLHFLFSHLPSGSSPDNTGSHLTTCAGLPLQEASAIPPHCEHCPAPPSLFLIWVCAGAAGSTTEWSLEGWAPQHHVRCPRPQDMSPARCRATSGPCPGSLDCPGLH